MLLRLFTALVLTFFCVLNAYAAREQGGLRQIGGSTVTWNDQRLSVELTNAPVKGVLEDLMENKDFVCQVSGDLRGTISITIDNLTIEETLHRIMRSRNYDYTMIMSESESADGKDHAVSELAIYQGENVVRFVRVPKNSPDAQPRHVVSVSKPAVPLPAEKPSPTNDATDEMRNELDMEIQSLMDEMLSREEISQSEYDEAMRTINDKGE